MTYWQTYVTPRNLDEALAALRDAPGPARLIAGGTDLLLDLQQGRQAPVDTLIDISRIPELREVRREGDQLFLGAAVTHAEIVSWPLVAEGAACLVEACALIGGPQVRNVATLGGNVAHGLPAADATIALLALDASAELATPSGRHEVPIEALFIGPGQVSFDRAETIVVGFRVRTRGAGEGSAFRRVMRPQGVAIAILNLAIWLRLEPDEVIAEARIALGPGGPRPRRSRPAEECLIGLRADAIEYSTVAAALLVGSQLRSSAHRATLDYRRHLLPVLLSRALPGALQDARQAAAAGVSA
jgi:CO/xanthine dehydrogenase FAD-binding subunit